MGRMKTVCQTSYMVIQTSKSRDGYKLLNEYRGKPELHYSSLSQSLILNILTKTPKSAYFVIEELISGPAQLDILSTTGSLRICPRN